MGLLQTVRSWWQPKPAPAARRRNLRRRPSALDTWALRGFAAAKQGEEIFAGFAGSPNSANGELYSDLRRMRQRSRQEANNDPYVVKFLEMFRTNVIGPNGMQLQADFLDDAGDPDPRDNELVESTFAEWGAVGVFDVTGKLSWEDGQNLTADALARDGEILVRMVRNADNRFRFALQFLEVDYLDEKHLEELSNGNRIVMGVEVNKWGRAVAYHLRPRRAYFDPASGFQRAGEDMRVPAEEMLHLFPVRRPEQFRGIPLTHASLRRLHQLDGFEEAEVVAARIAASKMGFFTTPTGDEFKGDDEAADGSKITEADPGTFHELAQGQTFEPWDPQHPNGNYGDFIKASLRGVAAGLTVQYNSLAGDLESVSWSSLRHSALAERDTWRCWQRWFARSFCQPVYEQWFDMAVLSGQLPVPARRRQKFMRTAWQPRGWQWVDPLKEIEAAEKSILLGVATRQDILSAQGKDFADVIAQLVKEKQALEKAGLPGLDTKPSKVSSPKVEDPAE